MTWAIAVGNVMAAVCKTLDMAPLSQLRLCLFVPPIFGLVNSELTRCGAKLYTGSRRSHTEYGLQTQLEASWKRGHC